MYKINYVDLYRKLQGLHYLVDHERYESLEHYLYCKGDVKIQVRGVGAIFDIVVTLREGYYPAIRLGESEYDFEILYSALSNLYGMANTRGQEVGKFLLTSADFDMYEFEVSLLEVNLYTAEVPAIISPISRGFIRVEWNYQYTKRDVIVSLPKLDNLH